MSKQFIILSIGGVGDALVCTPAYKALKETYPDSKIIVYSRRSDHRAVFRNNPYIDAIRDLRLRSMWRYPAHLFDYLFRKYRLKYYLMGFQHIPLSWIYSKNVKEIVPEIFDIKKIRDNKVQLFFTREEEERAKKQLEPYRNVVFMHISSRSSVNHHWDLHKWAELVKQAPELTFIQLGNTDEPYVEGAVDWRGKTDLREAFCMLKHACSFVGVDSSFSHATNAFDLPGVVLFGDSSPVYWGHDNNINIYKGMVCSPCFYYLRNDPCPYGNECMRLITVEEVKQALMRQVAFEGKKYSKQKLNTEL